MKAYGVNELRRMFLDFFKSKDHLTVPSYSLIPHNDKSLLLINAGMAPLKPYFTGQEVPPSRRMATCQKCVRTGDIENVGKTARHLTFFEMLGNFSFGDYFKKEALNWSWEFLTKVVGLDPDRLYPSIYYEDDEAFKIWTEDIGVPAEKITRFYRDENGKSDNFWEHGAGPCGPCSEIYYDRGEKYGCGKPDCGVGCECDRYMEVWNDVFTQFESDGNGHYTELAQKNIDTGMGLERLAVVVQDVDSVFDIDTMKAIRDKVCEISGKTYKSNAKDDVSIRLITDHIRSSVFLISDGVTPSNEGRGYVLRRLIRRAARHGRMLGIQGTFLDKIAETVIHECEDGYPELAENKTLIFKVLNQEEEQFNRTIDQGLEMLSGIQKTLMEKAEKILPGEEAFRLYDTYGFPIDLTREILAERGIQVDLDGFKKAMEKQRERARDARQTTNYMGADVTVYEQIDPSVTTEFVGYDHLEAESMISALTTDTELVDSLSEGMTGTVITKETPFYGEMGGQNADTGIITADGAEFEVTDVQHLMGGKIGHIGTVKKGSFSIGDIVTLKVDKEKRALTARNHSATHLLQAALRQVLGTHVQQKGSDVNPERLRFDFTHFSAMTPEELAEVETIVNREIEKAVPVQTDLMTLEEARKSGAMALFGEKYGHEVRVVRMGGFSKELCGGTHVANTGNIGAFHIISESSAASGVRRIEALTSRGLLLYFNRLEKGVRMAAKMLKTTADSVVDKIGVLQEDVRDLNSEIESMKSKEARAALGDVSDSTENIAGVNFVAKFVDNVDMNGLRELGDQLKDSIGEGVVVLASDNGGKVSLMATATPGAIEKGAHAGNLIREIAEKVGGRGGGRPNMAQAGGKNPNGIPDALATASEVLKKQLQSES